MKNRFLIMGASGLVGSKFAESLTNERKKTPNEIDVDITNPNLLSTFFDLESNNFDTVVNFAAFTNVDAAEKERGDEEGLCYRLNVEGAKNLAEVCAKFGKFLIHISTDFVFEGTDTNPGPYSEDAQKPNLLTDKLSWYGWTKNLAEQKITSVNSKSAIIRIAFPFSPSKYSLKSDLAHGILKLYDEQRLHPFFSDQTISVLLIEDLIPVIKKIAENQAEGVFHCVSKNTTTTYEFASYLLQEARNSKFILEKGSMTEYIKKEGLAPRPRLGGLKTERTEKILGMKFKTWQEMVDEFVAKLS